MRHWRMIAAFLSQIQCIHIQYVTINTVSCPDETKLVIHITTLDTTLFVHHHRHYQRVSCFSCFSPYHSSAKCAAHRVGFLFEYHREFCGTHQVAKTFSVLTFKHLNVAGHLQHVIGQAEKLQATTAKPKNDACKSLLLTKTSQSSRKDGPREDTPPPLLPVDSQRRAAVPQVPVLLLLMTPVRTRKSGTRVPMRLYLF